MWFYNMAFKHVNLLEQLKEANISQLTCMVQGVKRSGKIMRHQKCMLMS